MKRAGASPGRVFVHAGHVSPAELKRGKIRQLSVCWLLGWYPRARAEKMGMVSYVFVQLRVASCACVQVGTAVGRWQGGPAGLKVAQLPLPTTCWVVVLGHPLSDEWGELIGWLILSRLPFGEHVGFRGGMALDDGHRILVGEYSTRPVLFGRRVRMRCLQAVLS